MSRQIEQGLLSLMPTYGSDLPPSLVELAASLLAQSRHKASTLKADEEVARGYACCNLACDRLKITLNLPPIEPRPPIPPRIYKRLYTHLDNILRDPTTTPRARRPRTASAKQADIETPSKSETRQLPSRKTPTKEMSLARFRAATKTGTASAAKDLESQDSKGHVHPWIQPVIRLLCAETDNKRLAPTIFAGIEHILTPDGRPTEDQWVIQHVTDLVAAVFFFVITRARSITNGTNVNREEYVPLRKEILVLLTKAGMEVRIPDRTTSDKWEGWTEIKSREFDAAVAKVNENDWLSGDWYEGIDDVINSTAKTDLETLDDGFESSDTSLPTRRADSMIQEQFELLSEKHRIDFGQWSSVILALIKDRIEEDNAIEDFVIGEAIKKHFSQ